MGPVRVDVLAGLVSRDLAHYSGLELMDLQDLKVGKISVSRGNVGVAGSENCVQGLMWGLKAERRTYGDWRCEWMDVSRYVTFRTELELINL